MTDTLSKLVKKEETLMYLEKKKRNIYQPLIVDLVRGHV